MRDLNLDNFADELYDKITDLGADVPRHLVRRLTKKFFVYVEAIAAKGENRFMVTNRPITNIYPKFDVKSLCNELAMNERFILTADYLIRKNRLQKRVKKFISKRSTVTLNKEAA